jgi:hypothetical protein
MEEAVVVVMVLVEVNVNVNDVGDGGGRRRGGGRWNERKWKGREGRSVVLSQGVVGFKGRLPKVWGGARSGGGE